MAADSELWNLGEFKSRKDKKSSLSHQKVILPLSLRDKPQNLFSLQSTSM